MDLTALQKAINDFEGAVTKSSTDAGSLAPLQDAATAAHVKAEAAVKSAADADAAVTGQNSIIAADNTAIAATLKGISDAALAAIPQFAPPVDPNAPPATPAAPGTPGAM